MNESVTAAAGERTNFDLYAALLQGEYGGDDALAASQQMLQILMDSMTNAVFWKDRQSRYLGCNKVFAVVCRRRARGHGRPVGSRHAVGRRPRLRRRLVRRLGRPVVVETGEPRFGIIERLRSAAGDVRWIETNKVPLRDPRAR